MKRFYRVLAVVLSATMLMACCAFAIDDEKRSLTRESYGCDCNSNGSSAYTDAGDPVGSISASFSGTITLANGAEVGTSGSQSRQNFSYVSCGDTSYAHLAYAPASGYIYASHAIENIPYFSQSGF